MDFKLEQQSKGKPCIVYNQHKYRESYTLKNGESVWRCLGRTCTAKLKTDAIRSTIIDCVNTHSGPHPVTMRSITSPLPTSPKTPALVSGSHAPRAVTPATHLIATTPSVCETPAEAFDSSTPSSSAPHPVTPEGRLQEQNSILKNKVDELEHRLQCVLDHSIESDTRLLQFTNEVFVANISPPKSLRYTVECGIQCDMPGACQDQRCGETRELVQQLRTTIEVLEAELQCLRADSDKHKCTCKTSSSWTVVKHKKQSPGVVKNRVDSLNSKCTTQIPTQQKNYNKTQFKSVSESKITRRVNQKLNEVRAHPQTTKNISSSPYCLSFSSIKIESDSHGRHLAGFVRNLISPSTEVTGFCKPGARLLNVVSRESSLSLPGSCNVLVAGTNDVADGQQHVIHENLEKIIDARLRVPNSTVIVATLPFRHDLPHYHPVNKKTVLVNSFIKDACKRRNILTLDFNRIGRRWFTRHGMHLRLRGKWLLARMLVESLVRSDRLAAAPNTSRTPSAPASPLRAPSPCPTAPVPDVLTPDTLLELSASAAKSDNTQLQEPVTLPHDTYADAVKQGPSTNVPTSGKCVLETDSSFLLDMAVTTDLR